MFEQRIFPVLTPLAVDPGHPFPYISNLSLNLAVIVRDPVTGERRFARVKVPDLLPRFVVMPDGERFVPLEQVIAAHLDQLFPGHGGRGHHYAFRVTRNADLTLEEEEADDLLAAVEIELRRRRFGRAVRLEIGADITDEVRELLQRELDLGEDDVYRHAGPARPRRAVGRARARPARPQGPGVPRVSPSAGSTPASERLDFFAVLREGDVLVHHPYDSFPTSVEEFIRQASVDPKVLAIKLTLYRTSGDSPIVRSLIRAAERGKQVAALVELKARFDEEANIEWARRWRRRASTSSTGWSGSRPTPRPRSSSARRPTASAATATSAPATTTRRRPGSTRTSACSPPTPTSAPTSPSCSTSSPATAATCATGSCSWRPHTLRPGIDELDPQRDRRGPRRRPASS